MVENLIDNILKSKEYYGRILLRDYSDNLKQQVSKKIFCLRDFDKINNPAIPYISAWKGDEKAMWYEFIGCRFVELMGCQPCDVPDMLRKNIIERRVYTYKDMNNIRIQKQTIQHTELGDSREVLRKEGEKRGLVEAVYKTSLGKGDVVWLKDQAFVEVFKKDKIYLSSGCLTIVTKEMEAEEELSRTKEVLEFNSKKLNRAKELQEKNTTELSKAIDQIEAAKEEAVKANKAKSEFLAVISHEIRNPMNGILGACDLVMGSELNLKQKEHLNIIRSSARALLGIINDILDFSKIEAGKLELENISFNPREIIEEVSDMFLELMSKKGIELVVDIAPDVPLQVVADPLRLRQIIINLTSNALKFTEKGEICIIVKNNSMKNREAELLFCVRDTGHGIIPEKIKILFDPFTQVDSSYSRKSNGTGLGLAICRQIVEMMGGSIWVESKPGKGSSFFFKARFKFENKAVAPAMEIPQEFRELTAMIVEDNPTALKVMKQCVESFGFQTATCGSGEKVVDIFCSKDEISWPDLIIMDLSLPGMDGITTAKKIRELSDKKIFPAIIAVSALGRGNDVQRAKEAGVDSFLIKPVKQSFLLETIKEIMGFATNLPEKNDIQTTRQEYSFDGHILLVEDNSISRRIACEILELKGLTVDTAKNGSEAVEAVHKCEYDVVLMDIQMPEMDGIEATRIIRQQFPKEDLPIIAMTAHAMKNHRDQCLQSGMDDYTLKPIDQKDLFALLRKYIKQKEVVSSFVDEKINIKKRASIIPKDNSFSGLDIHKGVERLGGHEDIYIDIVKDFCNDQKEFVIQLQKHIEKKNFKRAAEQAHSLKGAAGNISAVKLASIAKQLELSCRIKEVEQIPGLLKSVEVECKQIFEFVEKLPRQVDKRKNRKSKSNKSQNRVFDKTEEPIVREYLLEQIKELSDYLNNFDPVQSKKQINRISTVFDTRMGGSKADIKKAINSLAYNVKNYNFEEAKTILEKMVTTL